MKVQNINYHMMINPHKPKYGLEESSMGVDLCDNQSVGINTSVNKKQGYYNGSFTGKEKAAVSFSVNMLNKINEFTHDHNTITQSIVALVLAGVFRPAAIISLPGKKNKEDKIYASSHSIASGLIGFAVSSIIVSPLDKAAKQLLKEANDIKDRLSDVFERRANGENIFLSKEELLKGKEILGEKFLNIYGEFKDGNIIKINRKALNSTSTILNMAPDTLFLGVVKAMLTIALIPPILKYVFGVEKSKPQEAQPQQPAQQSLAGAQSKVEKFVSDAQKSKEGAK